VEEVCKTEAQQITPEEKKGIEEGKEGDQHPHEIPSYFSAVV